MTPPARSGRERGPGIPVTGIIGHFGGPPDPAGPDDRPTALRLARVHLRMGSLALARAELEAMAGHRTLDADALLDLAEVRWRTGDLAGAGDAANSLLERGRGDPLALVIAAEAVAELGRPGEARRLVGRALAAVDGSLDPLFAGMPRSAIWPTEAVPEPEADERSEDTPPARAIAHRAHVSTAPAGAHPTTPASTSAAEAFAGGLAALGGGDAGLAALRLGVALRLDAGYAAGVLEAIGDRASQPVLALVAGDALRLLGHESEALVAFDRARGLAPASVPAWRGGDGAARDPGSDQDR